MSVSNGYGPPRSSAVSSRADGVPAYIQEMAAHVEAEAGWVGIYMVGGVDALGRIDFRMCVNASRRDI